VAVVAVEAVEAVEAVVALGGRSVTWLPLDPGQTLMPRRRVVRAR